MLIEWDFESKYMKEISKLTKNLVFKMRLSVFLTEALNLTKNYG
jgi:hypothetical protein